MKKGKILKTLTVLSFVLGAFFCLLGCKNNSNFTITYDYGVARDFFENVQDSKTIKSTEWLTGMPTIKAEYKDAFLGWYVQGTDTQIKECNLIGGNATLEARFDITQAPSGLYQNGKYVKKWSDIKEEYPNAFSGTTIVRRSNANSYFSSLRGDLVIDNEITSIEDSAFYGCTSLTSVIIGNSVTSIGYDVFYKCTSLTSVVIPDSVTYIGGYAFSGCTSLTSVYYTGTEVEWNNISINSSNRELINATRYYYTEIKPAENDKYWHYVDGVPTVWTSEE